MRWWGVAVLLMAAGCGGSGGLVLEFNTGPEDLDGHRVWVVEDRDAYEFWDETQAQADEDPKLWLLEGTLVEVTMSAGLDADIRGSCDFAGGDYEDHFGEGEALDEGPVILSGADLERLLRADQPHQWSFYIEDCDDVDVTVRVAK